MISKLQAPICGYLLNPYVQAKLWSTQNAYIWHIPTTIFGTPVRPSSQVLSRSNALEHQIRYTKVAAADGQKFDDLTSRMTRNLCNSLCVGKAAE